MDRLIERELLAQRGRAAGLRRSATTRSRTRSPTPRSSASATRAPSPGSRRTASSTTSPSSRSCSSSLGITPEDLHRAAEERASGVPGPRAASALASPSRRRRSRPSSCARTARSTWSTCASPAAATQATVAPTEAEIADYAAKNEAKLREAYEQKKFVYEKVAAAAAATADPDQAGRRRQAGGREGRPRQGRGALVKLKKGAAAHRQGGADVRRARDPVLGRRRDQGARAAISGGGPRARPTSRARPRRRSSPPSRARWSGRSRGPTATSSPRSRGRARATCPSTR